MSETLTLRGELTGHKGWVTAIAPPLDPSSDVLLSSSRCAAPDPGKPSAPAPCAAASAGAAGIGTGHRTCNALPSLMGSARAA